MKPTENLDQLLERFTKRITQIEAKEQSDKTIEQLHYLRGCKDTIIYLQTGKLPNDVSLPPETFTLNISPLKVLIFSIVKSA